MCSPTMRHSATEVQLQIARAVSPTAFDAQRGFDDDTDHEHQRQAHQRTARLEKRHDVDIRERVRRLETFL